MLRLINVTKIYKDDNNKNIVLDNVNIDFKKNELVFILGSSGSGKTTLLNIIAGLINVTSGNVFLDDLDITKFNSKELCNYRNNMIGYVYQDYHLIDYMSVLDNVKLGQTIFNGNNNIDNILDKVGLLDKKKVIVSKLSGGERQRVAIARALINDAEIILCDEPTGALDSVNSIKIMDILKEISKDKLVIVVSHDNYLANRYASRIINICDGKVLYQSMDDRSHFKKIVNKRIKFMEILKLAFINLKLKKVRTIFTSLAISLGFLCMMLVLNLSFNFNNMISDMENDIVSKIPINISNMKYQIVDNDIEKSNDKIIYKDISKLIHKNEINDNYINYLKNIDEISYISYDYDISFPVISDNYYLLDNNYMKMVPDNDFLNKNYELLYGNYIESKYDIVLKVDSNNNVSSQILNVFNISNDISYSELIGRKLRVIINDDYYFKNANYYYVNNDNKLLYENSNIMLNIVGIVREKEIINDNNCFYYSGDFINDLLDINKNSKIVLEQLNREDLVLNLDNNKESLLSYLGYNTIPSNINVYVDNLENKKIVLSKLDEYNKNYSKIIYNDNLNDTINIIKDMINVITLILVIFSLISIVISSLMIFILTSNRVVSSTKEIGILRCLGARGSDIRKLFNVENIIIGFISILFGISLMWVLRVPINQLLSFILMEECIISINYLLVFICVIFNIFMVLISGYIPSYRASRKKIIDSVYKRY